MLSEDYNFFQSYVTIKLYNHSSRKTTLLHGHLSLLKQQPSINHRHNKR